MDKVPVGLHILSNTEWRYEDNTLFDGTIKVIGSLWVIMQPKYHLIGCILLWGNQGQGPSRSTHPIEHRVEVRGQYLVRWDNTGDRIPLGHHGAQIPSHWLHSTVGKPGTRSQ